MTPAPTGSLAKAWWWLGTRVFWLAFVGVVLIGAGVVGLLRWRLTRRDALVPVVTLSGPHQADAGQSLRYAVLVRDRFGAPLPRALVRVGFARTHLLELARGTSNDGGETSVEIRFPEDFAERRYFVAIAEAGVANGTDVLIVEPSGRACQRFRIHRQTALPARPDHSHPRPDDARRRPRSDANPDSD